jgi:two-component system nitrate/nitrite response regulator NarL
MCSLRIAARLFQRLADRPAPLSAPQPALTLREAEIVQLLAEGLCNKEIARRLDIGLATTKSHVHNLLTKLSLTRRGQAAVWLRQHSADIVRAS